MTRDDLKLRILQELEFYCAKLMNSMDDFNRDGTVTPTEPMDSMERIVRIVDEWAEEGEW